MLEGRIPYLQRNKDKNYIGLLSEITQKEWNEIFSVEREKINLEFCIQQKFPLKMKDTKVIFGAAFMQPRGYI